MQQFFNDLRQEYIIQHSAVAGSWFSLPCVKIHGKIFAALWTDTDELIVKLPSPQREDALKREGVHLFQPLPERKPMQEWVQVPAAHAEQWPEFVHQAFEYVQTLAKAKKNKK
ncbi:MAG: hypothetical protein ACLFTK_14200 [Anaerolineales bacterium]